MTLAGFQGNENDWVKKVRERDIHIYIVGWTPGGVGIFSYGTKRCLVAVKGKQTKADLTLWARRRLHILPYIYIEEVQPENYWETKRNRQLDTIFIKEDINGISKKK